MNWEAATCLEFAPGFNERMFLESWHTKSDSNSINICRDMPGAYYSLIAIERACAEFLNTRASNLATFHLTQDNNDKLSLVKIVVFENGFCIGNRNVRQSN